MNTGHVKQAAAFEKLVACCSAQGAMYNPSNEAITLTALQSLLTSAHQSLEAVKVAQLAYTNGVIIRKKLFDDMPVFLTRVIHGLAASGASAEVMEEAYRYVRKYKSQGRDREPLSSTEATATVSATRSTAQLDFDRKADHFNRLVKLVHTVPGYRPNEEDLQLVALDRKAAELYDWNKRVVHRLITLANARAHRNRVLYGPTGTHGVAMLAKKYVRSAFGYRSAAAQQIGRIQLLNHKK